MDHSKISVIVPVYKVELFLRHCLDSIVNQTYKNLEIILVDDGSPDNCGAICEEYAERDSRIKVIHQENRGVSAARNAGLSAATGDWIGFVDGDDWIEPDMYEYLLEMAQQHDADMAQCGLFFDEKKESNKMFCADREYFFSSGMERFSTEDWERIGKSTCNKLYRAACLNGVVYDAACPMGEDLLFNLYALRQGSGIVLGTQAKYHYIQHDESACHAPPNAAYIRSHRELLKKITNLFSKYSAAYAFFDAERLRMDMHYCSRIVQFPEMKLDALKNEIQTNLRRETLHFMRLKELSKKEKGKLLLIAWAWWLYWRLLLISKSNLPRD